MRFGYVLLGLVALTSIHTSSGQCSNGLAGVQDNDICCDADCGTCGGGGCGRRPGGASNCCTSRVRDSGAICSETQGAPCIIENESMCDNGLPGVQSGDICCDASCGTCGGSGCAGRPGGSSNCCSSRIRDSGLMCGTTLASPCIVNALTAACNPNPCGNGGSCTIDPAGGHTCSCTGDFGGMSCQIDTSDLATFFIEIVFIGTWTDARRAVLQSAADRWSEIITHVPCGGTVELPAGRLQITATLAAIDGVGGTTGSAGVSSVWGGCLAVSAEGTMKFDTADIAAMEADGSFAAVTMHEMGHVIGIGTIWGTNFGGCTTCRQTGNPAWTCPAALSAYADIGGTGAAIVETDGPSGSSCNNLDELIFGDELMSAVIENTNVLSKITAAVLEDLEYIVDASAVDAYILPSKRTGAVEDPPVLVRLDDIAVETSIQVLDDEGGVVETIDSVELEF